MLYDPNLVSLGERGCDLSGDIRQPVDDALNDSCIAEVLEGISAELEHLPRTCFKRLKRAVWTRKRCDGTR